MRKAVYQLISHRVFQSEISQFGVNGMKREKSKRPMPIWRINHELIMLIVYVNEL